MKSIFREIHTPYSDLQFSEDIGQGTEDGGLTEDRGLKTD